MKVGDLVKWRIWYALVVKADEWETLVKWLHDGTIENTINYHAQRAEWEVVSES